MRYKYIVLLGRTQKGVGGARQSQRFAHRFHYILIDLQVNIRRIQSIFDIFMHAITLCGNYQ
jgi:hypothetical protein